MSKLDARVEQLTKDLHLRTNEKINSDHDILIVRGGLN